MSSIKPSVIQQKCNTHQRLVLLEATARWGGQVITRNLIQLFNMARDRTSKNFSHCHPFAESHVFYDQNQKTYFPSTQFVPRFLRGAAEDYFCLIKAENHPEQSGALSIFPTDFDIELLQLPERKRDCQSLRAVHQSLREKRRRHIRYQSLPGETADSRTSRPRIQRFSLTSRSL